jgi:hypothetical protein
MSAKIILMSEYLSTHPKLALFVGAVHIVFSEWVRNAELPKIVMQTLQGGAWCVTIAVGLVTLYGAYKKRKK